MRSETAEQEIFDSDDWPQAISHSFRSYSRTCLAIDGKETQGFAVILQSCHGLFLSDISGATFGSLAGDKRNGTLQLCSH